MTADHVSVEGAPAPLDDKDQTLAELRRALKAARAERDTLAAREARYRALFQSSVDAISIFDVETHQLVDVNDAWIAQYGYTRAEALSMRTVDVSAEPADTRQAVARSAAKGDVVIPERRHRRKDGSELLVRITAGPFVQGERRLMYSILRDVTEERRVEEQLKEERRRLTATQAIAKLGSWELDVETRKLTWSRETFRMAGLEPREEAPSLEEYLSLLHPDDRPVLDAAFKRTLAGEPYLLELRQRQPDEGYKTIIARARPVFRDGKVIRLRGSVIDISERRAAELALEDHSRRLARLGWMSRSLHSSLTEEQTYPLLGELCSQLFAGSAGALHTCAGSGNADQISLKFVAGWGEDEPELACAYWSDLERRLPDMLRPCGGYAEGDDPPTFHAAKVEGLLAVPIPAQGAPMALVLLKPHLQHRDTLDGFIDRECLFLHLLADHYALTLSNLQLQQQLWQESVRDPLTGLYNRRHMEAALEREAQRVRRHKGNVGIVMLDLDHFKAINDHHGHEAGDEVLLRLAELLKGSTRGEDVVCRFGGEEFVLLLPNTTIEAAQQRAEEILEKLRAMEVRYGEVSLRLTASAGVTTLSREASPTECLAQADRALYRAKENGRDQVMRAAE